MFPIFAVPLQLRQRFSDHSTSSAIVPTHLERLTKLESLDVATMVGSIHEFILPIAGLTNLTSLSLRSRVALPTATELISVIQKLTNLRTLNLRSVDCPAKVDSAPLIQAILDLEKIEVVYLPNWVEHWERLSSLKTLQRLALEAHDIQWLFYSSFPEAPDMHEIQCLCAALIEKVEKFHAPVTCFQSNYSASPIDELSLLAAVVSAGNDGEMDIFLKNSHKNPTFDPNFAPPAGRPPLFYVANEYSLERLLASGANLNATVLDQGEIKTAVTTYIQAFGASKLQRLVECGADLSIGSPPPLAVCLRCFNNEETFKLVFECSKDDLPSWDDHKLGQVLHEICISVCPGMSPLEKVSQIIGLDRTTKILKLLANDILPFLPDISFGVEPLLVELLLSLDIDLKQTVPDKPCPIAWYLYNYGSEEVRQVIECRELFTEEELMQLRESVDDDGYGI
jgi:hypothetical protein